ncbi:TRAP transporter small permease [Roseivirga sp. BDSF3-8]|uniref:TRAP transporter small permease n=1 Tax=Roseivirga sp. BDSF3-8 TaxID=3241598 RepID=UPI0035321956
MRNAVNRALEIVIVVLLALMTLDVLYGVATRYLLNNQSEWSDELSRFLMIWVSILGAAYAAGSNLHISIDLLPRYLSEKGRRRLHMFISVIVILFVFAVFVVGGLRYIYISFTLGQVSPALQLPVGYVYVVLPLSGLFIIYYKLHDLMQLIQPRR